MNLEKYAKYEERSVYEVWDGLDFHESFETAEEAQSYIEGAEYPEQYDWQIIENFVEVKVYDFPENERTWNNAFIMNLVNYKDGLKWNIKKEISF